jgi:iron complex transport system substrate-binding protein
MKISEETALLVENTAAEVVDAAVRLHIDLGPRLLETVYEIALAKELVTRGTKIARQRAIDFTYKGTRFVGGFRVDLLVNECLVVESKSIEKLQPVHTKQLLTYLRLMQLPLGLLINFGDGTLRAGLRRGTNGYWPSSFSCLRANNPISTHAGPRG